MKASLAEMVAAEVRSQIPVWAVAVLPPLPALVLAPDAGVDMVMVYLGFGVALLAAGVFFAFGRSIRVQSNLPLGFLTIGSVRPGLGMAPYLSIRTGVALSGHYYRCLAAVTLQTGLLCGGGCGLQTQRSGRRLPGGRLADGQTNDLAVLGFHSAGGRSFFHAFVPEPVPARSGGSRGRVMRGAGRNCGLRGLGERNDSSG